MSTIKTLPVPEMEITCVCHTCKRRHTDRVPIISRHQGLLRALDEWDQKHPSSMGHVVEHYSRQRFVPRDLDDTLFERENIEPWWLRRADFAENGNIKIAYASPVALTMTSLNSLASDTNLLAGASAVYVDNSANLYLDYALAGFVKNNTSSAPTVGQAINVWLYRAYDDTPTFPDTLAGTDATKTITTSNILLTLGRFAASMIVAATTSQINPFDAGSVASYWQGHSPKFWSVFVVHDSGVATAASGNTITQRGIYATY